jgi:prolyl oligopeptidase
LAPRGDVVDTYIGKHGEEVHVPDPYRWMENLTSKKTQAWVDFQNNSTHSFMESLDNLWDLNKRLYDLTHVKSFELPQKHGDYYYFVHDAGTNTSDTIIYKMKKKDEYKFNEDNVLSSAEEFLDLSRLADGTEESASSESLYWSGNGTYIAYVTSIHGSDVGAIRVYDTIKKKDTSDVITDVKFTGATWDNNEKGFFYSRTIVGKDGNEYNKIFYHKLGNPESKDELVYENPHEQEASFNLQITGDGKYMLLTTTKGTEKATLKHFMDVEDMPKYQHQIYNFLPIVDEWYAEFSFIHNNGSKFFFKTNHKNPAGRIISMDIYKPQEENWIEILAGNEQNIIEDVNFANNKLIV